MLTVALSELVLICNIFEETIFAIFMPTCLLAFTRYILNFLQSFYFHLDDSELRKQYQSVRQEMMGQICDLETVEPQEIPIKVCVTFYNTGICYRECGEKKQVFLQSFNIPKSMVVGLLMVEGLFSLLFQCESGINQYTRQKTLAVILDASLTTCYYLLLLIINYYVVPKRQKFCLGG